MRSGPSGDHRAHPAFSRIRRKTISPLSRRFYARDLSWATNRPSKPGDEHDQSKPSAARVARPQCGVAGNGASAILVEPNAGHWRTWVIDSGASMRAPPPPSQQETRAELGALAGLVRHNDAKALQQIAYWDAGAPSYRWIELINARIIANVPTTAYTPRVYAYVAMAMHDATIATWESKYYYNRRRPASSIGGCARSCRSRRVRPIRPSMRNGTGGRVGARLFPAQRSRHVPGDGRAGGMVARARRRAISERLRRGARARPQGRRTRHREGTDRRLGRRLDGLGPHGAVQVARHQSGQRHGRQLDALAADVSRDVQVPATARLQFAASHGRGAAVKNFARTFTTNYKAYYWQSPEGRGVYPFLYAGKWMFEDALDQNPPRAARIYALLATAAYDAFIASQDSKFTYWYLRPHQLDASIVPLFPVPNFPSYPSNHSTFSTNSTELLAHLFPTRADFIAPRARRPAIPRSGPASTSRWTTRQASRSARRSRRHSSTGR
jgi:hypothetical protein